MADHTQEAARAASELKPCPFCGGTAHLTNGYATEALWAHGVFYRVFCGACQVRQLFHRHEAEAIAAWNRRAVAADTGMDGLPRQVEKWHERASSERDKNVLLRAEVTILEAEVAALHAELASRGAAQGRTTSIDTPEFINLLDDWQKAEPGETAYEACEKIIAHIDAWGAKKGQQ